MRKENSRGEVCVDDWRARQTPSLQRAEEFVEFVGSVEVSFQFARGQLFAEIVEAPGEKVEGGGEDLLIGENDVAPRGIWASSKTKRIAETGSGEGDGKAVFIDVVEQKGG